jgi:hypothetical protein
VTGLLTGHCHLKEHLFRMGLTDSPICERCLEKDESATHILCDCETSLLRFCQLGHYFVESGDCQDAPIIKTKHVIRSVGLLKGWNRGGCTIDHWKSRCKGRLRPIPYAFIHSFIHSFMFTIKRVPYYRSMAPHVVDGTDGLQTWEGGGLVRIYTVNAFPIDLILPAAL